MLTKRDQSKGDGGIATLVGEIEWDYPQIIAKAAIQRSDRIKTLLNDIVGKVGADAAKAVGETIAAFECND